MTLHINGETITVDAPEEMPLLWVIRDLIGYTGTKFGCGKGLCGACTVIVDGESVRSCSYPISYLDKESKIITIEGLKNFNKNLQRAWIESKVPQCGYCQPGQLMNAAGLLVKNTSPSKEEIITAMQGNICRCGTYSRIIEAIKNTKS